MSGSDVLIIGSGAAGLTAALNLAERFRVTVVAKGQLNEGSTAWAQGGIAAVLAFNVSARTNEIGIRMALGAAPTRVTGMILKEGGVLVVAGLLVGVLGSLVLSRFIEGLLFGIASKDPVTLAAVVVTMMAIGLAACWIPAAKASRRRSSTRSSTCSTSTGNRSSTCRSRSASAC